MRVLGLDIGMASIGFALLEYEPDFLDANGQIVTMGVHLFDKAEEPKTGAPLALARRMARQSRRTIRRRTIRLQQLRKLFATHDMAFLPIELSSSHTFEAQDAANRKFVSRLSPINPWKLRSEALNRLLTKPELARVLYHIAKHRGFRSTRKGETNDTNSESSKMLGAARTIETQFQQAQYQTIGAYFYAEKLLSGHKVRNGNGDYSNSILRKLNEQEVQDILKAQRDTFSQTWIDDDFIEKVCKLSFEQAPLRSVEHMVGECTLEKLRGNSIPRAPRYSRSAELFVLWQQMNHLRIIPKQGKTRTLTGEEKKAVYEKAHELKEMNFHQVRQCCCTMKGDDLFNLVRYEGSHPKKKKKSDTPQEAFNDTEVVDWEKAIPLCEKNKKFMNMGGYYALKKILGDDLEGKNFQRWDTIARILSFEQDSAAIKEQLSIHQNELALTDSQVQELSCIDSFRGTVNLSCKAIQALLPYLREGKNYDEAVELAGYHPQNNAKGDRLPPFEKTNNPVVNRALAQTRKVVNAVIREYDLPDKIHVELAREATRSFEDRRKMDKENDERRIENDALRQQAEKEFNTKPIKLKLWKEQQGICLYSLQPIHPEELSDNNATQIDHAVPYSLSYDNSYFNKVLVKTDENIRKKNRSVYDYFQAEKNMPEDWERLKEAIKFLPPQKQKMILRETQPDDEWKNRHLNDTRWITRAVKTHLEQHLKLHGENNDKSRRVLAVNGNVTHYLRGQWGLEKDRKESSKHHAQDAAVVAGVNEKIIKRVAEYNKAKTRLEGKKPHTPAPWFDFHSDVRQRVKEIFVSRMPRRSATGEIASPNPDRIGTHPETGERIVIERVELIKLNLKKLEKLIDKDSRNRKLYTLLQNRLQEHNDKGDKAFKEPFYLEGEKGRQRIQKVSLYGSPESGKIMRGGLVSNGAQVRVDVFSKNGKFYLCPVYAWHFILGLIPNRLVVQGKKAEDWLELNDEYQFHCSLYPNDFVQLTQKNDDICEGYYVTTGIAVAQIEIKSHDDSPMFRQKDKKVNKRNFGVLELKSLEKYQVDYFGRRSLVHEKIRPPIKQLRNKVKRLDLENAPNTTPV